MAGETYAEDLLRAVAAQLQFQCQMMAAQQMFGKGLFALAQPERQAVEQAVLGGMITNFQNSHPDALATWHPRPAASSQPEMAPKSPAGFVDHTKQPTPPSPDAPEPAKTRSSR